MARLVPFALLLASAAAAGAPTYRLPVSLGSVVKSEKARSLGPAARSALARDGAVAVAGRQPHFFSLYDENAYRGIPSFVTIDVLLHVFHVRFDQALKELEQKTIAPEIRAFAAGQMTRGLEPCA